MAPLAPCSSLPSFPLLLPLVSFVALLSCPLSLSLSLCVFLSQSLSLSFLSLSLSLSLLTSFSVPFPCLYRCPPPSALLCLSPSLPLCFCLSFSLSLSLSLSLFASLFLYVVFPGVSLDVTMAHVPYLGSMGTLWSPSFLLAWLWLGYRSLLLDA